MIELEAYVINVNSLKANDVIVTFITNEGIKQAYGKGYKNIKSRYHIMCNTGIKVKIIGKETKNFFQLYDYDLLSQNEIITLNYDIYMNYIQIVKLILRTKEYHDETSFILFEYMIENLEETPIRLLLDLWKVYFLKRENIIFDFENCIKCKAKENIITLSFYRGGYVCKDCYENERIIPLEDIKILKAFYEGRVSYLKKVNYPNRISVILDELLENFAGITIN